MRPTRLLLNAFPARAFSRRGGSSKMIDQLRQRQHHHREALALQKEKEQMHREIVAKDQLEAMLNEVTSENEKVMIGDLLANPKLFLAMQDMQLEEPVEQHTSEVSEFEKKLLKLTLSQTIKREFKFEAEQEYKINKEIVTKMTDMGFIIRELPRFTTLVKKAPKHLLVLKFDYRRRIMMDPKKETKRMDPDILNKMKPENFYDFMIKSKIMPPNMAIPQKVEDDLKKEADFFAEEPLEQFDDPPEDVSFFEIHVIKKNNSSLAFGATIFQGEVKIESVLFHDEDAMEYMERPPLQRLHMGVSGPERILGATTRNYPIKWEFLSENLQLELMNYLYSLGFHPEIGMCVEYLTWNREQRMYMAWLRDLYSLMILGGKPQDKQRLNVPLQ